jgi:PKHD-type hydroxylase
MNEHKIAEALVFCTDILSEELLDLIVKEIENIDNTEFEPSLIGSENQHELYTEIRNSKISWWFEEHWVSSIISHYINIANRNYWEYDLTHLESIQISKYGVEDHYTWHSDYGVSDDTRYTRKLSVSLLISDPSEYEGGDLEFIDYHGETVVAPKEKGTMIIFDSRIPHRVTPVTKGNRVSLVSWMRGPKLR